MGILTKVEQNLALGCLLVSFTGWCQGYEDNIKNNGETNNKLKRTRHYYPAR